MRRTIDLGGAGWTVEGFLGLDAAIRAAGRPGDADRAGRIAASVPGSILDDVWRAGLVEDPYVGLGSLAAEWVPMRSWLYRRSVDVPVLGAADRAWLAFDGLDHAGRVFWDGEAVARHEGMFVPFEVDLTGRVRGSAGDAANAHRREGVESHELAVVVEPAPHSEPQAGRTSRVRVHKSRMTYGWDFCPRMIHQGLWQSVRLETAGEVRIVDAWGRPELAPDLRSAMVNVEVVVDATVARSVRIEAEVTGGSAARTASDLDLPAGRFETVLRLEVPEPLLWWPNGLGQPVVHRLEIRVLGDGRRVDERSVPLGFRTVERIPNEGGPPGARPWTWVVNGRRLYVRGWNWVPLDAQYGAARPGRLGHLVRLARDANVNLLRVWGGGLIETRAFYDACDASGLMVWQELSQSSSLADAVPGSDVPYVAQMRREVEAIVPLRRSHPSLVAWCGGNELEDEHGPLEDDRSPVLAAAHEVVSRLDPDRVWLPTSPTGRRFHNRLDVIHADPDGLHDVHGPWEHQGLRAQHELYDRGTSLFNSEFGVEGMTNRRAHEALIPPEDRWPPTRANPVYRHLGDWWINEPLVQRAFGSRLDDLESLRRASQHLQADGLRYAVEANRRRAFRNSGSIPWQLNESYPNAWCTSAVDHRGDPKPAYFAVRRAYAPVVVAASFGRSAWGGASTFEAAIWAWSDGKALRGTATAGVLDVDGTVLGSASFAADLQADRPARLGDLTVAGPLPAVFVLDLALRERHGEVAGSNRYVLGGNDDLGPFLDVPAADVRWSVAEAGDRWDVRLDHGAGPAALGVRLEDDRPIDAPGWAEVDDGWFELLPGEGRSIGVRWADDGPGAVPRRLRLSGWNVADAVVAVA